MKTNKKQPAQLTELKKLIQEGLDSGLAYDFKAKKHLNSLKASKTTSV